MPNDYKGPSMDYGDGPGMHGESVKQERKDLIKDNPVVRDMDSSRPWMSKHFKSSMSPLKVAPDMGTNKKKTLKDKTLKDKFKAGVKKVKNVVSGAGEAISEFAQDFKERAT